jgi:LysR family glycine cleavage system transcriptional activator
MPRDLPALNAMRVFEAAARHQNFSRAAEELSVTQSAVSRQVQRLEAQLGQRLFVRNGPRLVLTTTGREYLQVVQDGLAVIRRGTARLFHRDLQPVLTLSVLPSLVSRWFIPRIADFEKAHPNVALRLSASYQVVDFAVSTDIDAAIRFGRGPWPGVEAEPILEDVIFPVCSPAKAAQLKEPADLRGERLLVEDPFWDLWGLWARTAGLEDMPPNGDRLSDDFSAQLQAATLGHGVALARGMLVADDLRSGQLVCPFPIAVRCPLQYYFVSPPGRRREPAIETTRQWLQEAAAATVAGMERYWGEPLRTRNDARRKSAIDRNGEDSG